MDPIVGKKIVLKNVYSTRSWIKNPFPGEKPGVERLFPSLSLQPGLDDLLDIHVIGQGGQHDRFLGNKLQDF